MRAYGVPFAGALQRTTRDPFRTLIGVVLSARTKDPVTADAAARLFRLARMPRTVGALPIRTIARAVYPVGMSATKARWVRDIARILVREHRGRVPRTREELLALPGVGRKVANLVLGLCFRVPAICVDTHVHRISNRLGLVRTATPAETERALAGVLPRRLWAGWNALLVTWGQHVCVPVSPFCSRCVLRARRLCPRVGVGASR